MKALSCQNARLTKYWLDKIRFPYPSVFWPAQPHLYPRISCEFRNANEFIHRQKEREHFFVRTIISFLLSNSPMSCDGPYSWYTSTLRKSIDWNVKWSFYSRDLESEWKKESAWEIRFVNLNATKAVYTLCNTECVCV